MRPRIAKAKSRGSFLGDEFVGRFDNRAKWITQLAGVFPVGVVDAPQLLAGLQSRARFHGSSSPQAVFAKMYQLHKMRGQSVGCPIRVPTKAEMRCGNLTSQYKNENNAWEYAVELGIAKKEVLKQGMEAKSKEFAERGAEVYAKA